MLKPIANWPKSLQWSIPGETTYDPIFTIKYPWEYDLSDNRVKNKLTKIFTIKYTKSLKWSIPGNDLWPYLYKKVYQIFKMKNPRKTTYDQYLYNKGSLGKLTYLITKVKLFYNVISILLFLTVLCYSTRECEDKDSSEINLNNHF